MPTLPLPEVIEMMASYGYNFYRDLDRAEVMVKGSDWFKSTNLDDNNLFSQVDGLDGGLVGGIATRVIRFSAGPPQNPEIPENPV